LEDIPRPFCILASTNVVLGQYATWERFLEGHFTLLDTSLTSSPGCIASAHEIMVELVQLYSTEMKDTMK